MSKHMLCAITLVSAALITPSLWAGQPLVYTGGASASGTVGGSFLYQMAATGGKSPYVFTISAGTLPAGLTFDNVSTITGAPSAEVTSTITVRVTDNNGTVVNTDVTITIDGGGLGGTSNFEFLTTTMLRATRSSPYSQILLVANAAGEVTFSVTGGQAAFAALGLNLNPKTGLISGIIPSGAGNASGDAVQFSAYDSINTITLNTLISTTSAGGSDFGFQTTTLPEGTVGTAYSAAVQIQGGSFTTSGLTNIRFGATDLPTGLAMGGQTGTIAGTPTTAGTFYVSVTATDQVDNNKALVILAIKILPAGSSFQFGTVILDNGEVGTAYHNQLVVTGGAAAVSYGATGLPAGLTLDPATGTISGTPTTAGTFLVIATATDGTSTLSLNRPLTIVNTGSNFYWFFSGGLPTSFLNQSYSPSSPPVTLVAHPFTNGIVYSATGLPSGMSYDAATGAITGTPIEPGIYPTTFSATNSGDGTQIVFQYDFIVLPPNGGDANNLPINFWVKKQGIKRTGTAGKDSWAAQLLYNADRRVGKIFDPATQTLSASLGSTLAINLAGGKLTGKNPKFSWKGMDATILPRTSPDPKLNGGLSIDMSKQVISLATKSETISDTVPSTFRQTLVIGNRSYKTDLFLDTKGVFLNTSGYRKTAFVAEKVKLTAKAAGKDSFTFSLLLADPAFTYTSGTSLLRFRLVNAGTVLADKTFTTLVTGTESTDSKTGAKVFKLKSGKDAEATNTLSKFSYDSKSGKLSMAMKNLTLSALTGTEAHVSVELTIGEKEYFTAITLFAPKAGSWTPTLPR